MPLNIDFLQVLLHMLNFVILAGGLTFLLFKPINKFLENRKAHFEKLERDNAESAETNAKAKAEYEQKLSNAEANVPNPKYMPKGCKFAPRCKYAFDRCREEEPGFTDLGNGHQSRCWRCMQEGGKD